MTATKEEKYLQISKEIADYVEEKTTYLELRIVQQD